jgi:hypothetical protein
VINWVSLCLPFFPSASSATTYIFIAPTCTTTIITLEPYALNVEFQHSIHRFTNFFSLYGYTERGFWKWKEAQRQGDFIINLNICTYTYMPQNTLHMACKCIWQICTLATEGKVGYFT